MKQLTILTVLKFGIVISFFLGLSNHINAQCYGSTAPDMKFTSGGGTLQRTIVPSQTCSGGTWALIGHPSWMATAPSISGKVVTASLPAYTGAERSGYIYLSNNGNSVGGIKVWQNKGANSPNPPNPPTPPTPSCSVSGFNGGTSFAATGEKRTYNLSYSATCSSNASYQFKQILNGQEVDLPNWVIPSQDILNKQVSIEFTKNSEETSRNIIIIGKRVGAPSIGSTFSQDCLVKTWYEDFDGDNFKDPNGQVLQQCAKPSTGEWTSSPETIVDNCPEVFSNSYGGCPVPDPDCTSFQVTPSPIEFINVGGTKYVDVDISSECTDTIIITYDPLPNWLSFKIVGTQIQINCAASDETRTVSIPVQVNGNSGGGVTIKQNPVTNPIDPIDPTDPSSICQANSVDIITLAALGETRQIDITFVNENVCSGTYYLTTPPYSDDLTWLEISDGVRSNGGLRFILNASKNNNDYGQSVTLILAKDDETGNPVFVSGFNVVIKQNSCLNTWYLDTDKDGFGDVYDHGEVGCTAPDPYHNWVTNNSDLCPEDYSLENQGCPVGEIPENHNTITTKSYDIEETLKSVQKGYYDNLGKPVQNQAWSSKTNDTWASQTLYDEAGRPALKTLAAPIRSGNDIRYEPNYIKTETNTDYDITDFTGNNAEAPTKAGSTEGTIGWYYSNNNTREEYQDATDYPFSKSVYSKLNPGAVLRSIGGNRVDTDGNGKIEATDGWAQGYSFAMRASDELNNFETVTQIPYIEYEIIKTVGRDVHGIENVSFTDISGKVLAQARSGAEGQTSAEMKVYIAESGYVDVHVPEGITGFRVNDASKVSVYNLITEELEEAATNTLKKGFYRVLVNDLDTYEEDSVYVAYSVNYYDFSLSEYDEKDRLIASYQPLNQLKTSYTYNTLNQVVKVEKPEAGVAEFIYRNDGQIRFSQNSKQAAVNEVSFTNYDELSRPVKSGVMLNADFSSLVATSPTGTNIKEELTTSFDAVPVDDTTLQGLPSAYRSPSFLSGNVARTKNANATTYYSYDIYGRVKWIVQDIVDIGLKTIDYVYEPITGLVTQVDYQKESTPERFVHKYEYNDANELVKALTSTDGLTFNLQAEYFYYETGALKRTELANGAQGVDYVYNLNGQLKGINHPDLDAAKDPGEDSNDLFGMQIDYHNNDYKRNLDNIKATSYGEDQLNGNIKGVRWNNSQFANTETAVFRYIYNRNNWLTEAKYGTFNPALGNSLDDEIVDPNQYDSTNGAVAIEASKSITLQNGFHAKANSNVHIRIVPNDGFKETNGDYNVTGITYDANGNIKTLNRNKNTVNGENTMDQLVYEYYQGTESGVNTGTPNQLQRVEDAVTRETDPKDIKGQEGNNYHYNSIGQLESNDEEGISYTYNTTGLVTQVSKNNVPLVKFSYDDRNKRVKKERFENGTLQQQTHYVRDAYGRVLAIYNALGNATPSIEEHPIYGANRIGIFKRPGLHLYQLTDHLGNVRATFGTNLSSSPVGENFNDYYPFGMLMAGRNGISDYRYAFQGQEKDGETGKEAFELRLWDSRIGRWLTTDPAGQFHSPYLGMGNDPINSVDPDGAFKWKWWAKTVNFLIGGDGVNYSDSREEWYVKKFSSFDNPDGGLDGIGIEVFFSSPIELYAGGEAGVTQGALGFDLKALGGKLALDFEHNKKNIIYIGGYTNDDFVAYNRYGDPSGNVNHYDVAKSRTSKIGIGGIAGGEVQWNTSRLKSDRILGFISGVGERTSETISIPYYGNHTTNFDGSGLTTTTRSWDIGGAVNAIFGVHFKLEVGYNLNYQVNKNEDIINLAPNMN